MDDGNIHSPTQTGDDTIAVDGARRQGRYVKAASRACVLGSACTYGGGREPSTSLQPLDPEGRPCRCCSCSPMPPTWISYQKNLNCPICPPMLLTSDFSGSYSFCCAFLTYSLQHPTSVCESPSASPHFLLLDTVATAVQRVAALGRSYSSDYCMYEREPSSWPHTPSPSLSLFYRPPPPLCRSDYKSRSLGTLVTLKEHRHH